MIRLKIETQEPVHIAASQSVSSFSLTLEYIPGTTLRGALANIYLRIPGNEAGEAFHQFFLSPLNWFSPLYPSGKAFLQDSNLIPQTAFTCKYHPGFKPHQHGVSDLLPHYLDKGTTFIPKCEQCGADLVPFRGFYGSRDEKPAELINVSKRLITKSAIDSRTETAASAQLYTTEVIEEGQKFFGFINLGMADSDFFEEWLLSEILQKNRFLRLGQARSRGFGLVEIVEAKIVEPHFGLFCPSTDNDFVYRLTSFMRRLREAGFDTAGDDWFSLTTLTDCIVTDRYLRYANSLTPEILSKYTGQALDGIVLEQQFASTKIVESWHALHGLPRPAQSAITGGSVFVYRIKNGADEVKTVLKSIERSGIGERKTVGFGRVIVNHPFHTVREVY
jgi:CRISPR-associated protein Csx10